METTRQLNVRVPDGLASEIKLRAINEDRPLQAVVANALEQYLKQQSQAERPRRKSRTALA